MLRPVFILLWPPFLGYEQSYHVKVNRRNIVLPTTLRDTFHVFAIAKTWQTSLSAIAVISIVARFQKPPWGSTFYLCVTPLIDFPIVRPTRLLRVCETYGGLKKPTGAMMTCHRSPCCIKNLLVLGKSALLVMVFHMPGAGAPF